MGCSRVCYLYIFVIFFLLLISSYIPLCLEKTFGMISVLNCLRFICDLTCDLSWRVFCVYIEIMFILLLLGGMFYVSIRST